MNRKNISIIILLFLFCCLLWLFFWNKSQSSSWNEDLTPVVIPGNNQEIDTDFSAEVVLPSELSLSDDTSPSRALEIYERNFTEIQTGIQEWDLSVIDYRGTDVLAQLKYTCDTFSDNLRDIPKLKNNLRESKDIFILPDEWVFDSLALQEYNVNMVDFYTDSGLSFDTFYKNVQSIASKFVPENSQEAENLQKLVDVYVELYISLYNSYISWEDFNCNNFIEKNYDIIFQEYWDVS